MFQQTPDVRDMLNQKTEKLMSVLKMKASKVLFGEVTLARMLSRVSKAEWS